MKAFTLLETLIYIALLAVLMSGALLTSYQIISASGSLQQQEATQDEGSFVLRKLDWVLSGIPIISTPTTTTPYASSLALANNGLSILIIQNAGAIEMSEDGGATFLPLTSSNASTTNLQFHYVAGGDGEPAGIEASTTINGVVFYTEKYFQQ